MGWTKTGKDGLCRRTKKRADGTIATLSKYYVRVSVGGRDIRRSTGESSRSTARIAAAQIRAELLAESPDRERGLTLGVMRELHMADLERAARSSGHIKGVQYLWDQLQKRLHSDPMRLSYARLVEYVDERVAEVKGQTVRKELQVLKRGLRLAKRHGYAVPRIDDWPEVQSSPKNTAQAGSLHDPEVIQRWLDELHRSSTLSHRSSLGPYLQASIAILTGLRATELRRLSVSWVEMLSEDSAVPALLRIPAEASKTRTERTVALTEAALDIIGQADELAELGAPLVPGTHAKAYANAARRIGYSRTITLRDLRHCYATWASETGDLAAVSAALGHTDLRTTSRYVHGGGERTAIASSAVGAKLDRIWDTSGGTPQAVEVVHPDSDPASTEIMVVGVAGFEPTTSCSRSRAIDALMEVLGDLSTAIDCVNSLESAGVSWADWDTSMGHLREVV